MFAPVHQTYKRHANNNPPGPARVAASIQQQTFTGSPRFDPRNGEYIPPQSPSWRFIGSGPEVDAAWEELSRERYFLLTDEEAREAWGDGYTQYWNNQWGGYLGGYDNSFSVCGLTIDTDHDLPRLDMFHTLHCLDHIRMSFYSDEYVLDGIHGEMHQSKTSSTVKPFSLPFEQADDSNQYTALIIYGK
ncbi:hypothetical protein F5Y10DRAFT_270535 [Nemania abortiva]|nr:hypothetical protein F5Y10DRAFT_270535 [Nemania abortiva]